MNDFYKHKQIHTYREFVQIVEEIRKNRRHDLVAFRGHGESQWPLVATLLRDVHEKGQYTRRDITKAQAREFDGVRTFARIADRIGYNLPGDIIKLLNDRTHVESEKAFYWQNTLVEEFLEVTTIAQHYGVATRFLDFTADPYCALYFAVEDAVRRSHRAERVDYAKAFCVWFMDGTILEPPEYPLRKYEAPLSRNAFLRAQQGFFIALAFQEPKNDEETLCADTLDILVALRERAAKIVDLAEGVPGYFPVVYRIDVPYKYMHNFVMELENRGINAMSIYPSLSMYKEYASFVQMRDWVYRKLQDDGEVRC